MSPFVWVETITLVNSHEHATITADKPIQVKYLGGKPNSSSSSGEIRGFTSLPSSALSNTYYAPVGSFEHYSSRSKKQTDAFFYNPQNSAIIIHWNSGAQSGSFTLSAHYTTSFHQKTRHYLTQDRATIFTSSQKYIAISTVGTNSPSYDWGYNLLPKEYLQNDYAIGWTETRTGGRDGTPLFITASENGTSVFIDTNNDGTPDHTYLVDKYEMQKVYDTSSSHNFQGAHIWSTRPIAIVWGQDPSRA
ncbi:MAG: hypothetical protein U9R50_08920, partial [Campylobacterota bacterium]|nr:hypothetical protein [Campylobacterota bacterium]